MHLGAELKSFMARQWGPGSYDWDEAAYKLECLRGSLAPIFMVRQEER